MKKILILNYNDLVEFVDCPTDIDNLFTVRRKDFIHQLEEIQQSGFPVLSLSEALSDTNIHPYCVCITIHGGKKSNFNTALKILRAYKMKASFFFGMNDIQKNEGNKELFKNLVKLKMDIGCYNEDKIHFKNLSRYERYLALSQVKQKLEEVINQPIRYYSLKKSANSHKIDEISKEMGFETILTNQFKINKINKKDILNYWSIQNNTSLSEFKKVLFTKKSTIRQKTFFSLFHLYFQNIIGQKTSHRIHEKYIKYITSPTKG